MSDPAGQRAGVHPAHVLLLLPAALLLVVFLASLGSMAWLSVAGPDGLTLEPYVHFFGTPVYSRVLWKTFRTAGLVTLCTLVVGYPLSYLLSRVGPRAARLIMIAVILPFFTSVMVRTYAWIVILGRRGLVNESLKALGVLSDPLSLLYNPSAVLLGMTYVMLPYMVLTLYSVMRGIDRTLLRAAQNLGAGSLETFRRVILPLTLPGVMSGSLLVFLLSLGFFITPALMGGPADVLLAMLVEREIELTMNWGFASAMAIVLLGITLAGFVVYYRLVGFGKMLEARE
jgi:putative spermidine/putrescine transport system permease protein